MGEEINRMGEDFFFPTPTAGAGAPQVEDGLALARFDDIRLVEHEDWAVEKDAYGNKDDGRRYHFVFTLMENKTTEAYGEDGDPIQLERLTRTATGKRSGFRAVMQGILTPAEFEAFLSATADAPFNGNKVKGRVYNVKVTHSSGGWPQIEDVIGVAK